MQISRDNPILLRIIQTLQRRYWYTHCRWAHCLRSIQHQRRNPTVHGIGVFNEVYWTLYLLQHELCTESGILQIARHSFANDSRLQPDGRCLNLLVRQFGIDTEVLPNTSNRDNLEWWRNTFQRSTYRRRLDPLVVQLLNDIHRLLELQRRAHQDGWGGHLSVRARDYRIYHRIARLSRLDGNRELVESITPLAWALQSEITRILQGTER